MVEIDRERENEREGESPIAIVIRVGQSMHLRLRHSAAVSGHLLAHQAKSISTRTQQIVVRFCVNCFQFPLAVSLAAVVAISCSDADRLVVNAVAAASAAAAYVGWC